MTDSITSEKVEAARTRVAQDLAISASVWEGAPLHPMNNGAKEPLGRVSFTWPDLETLLAHIATLAAENLALREALKPFAEAAEELDDEDHDKNGLWEHPAANTLTAGDLRRAAALLQPKDA